MYPRPPNSPFYHDLYRLPRERAYRPRYEAHDQQRFCPGYSFQRWPPGDPMHSRHSDHRPPPRWPSQSSHSSRPVSSRRTPPKRQRDRYYDGHREGRHEKKDDYKESHSTPTDVQQELISLQPAYVQCTQHSQYYGRDTSDSSTVRALPKLLELYDKFESELANRHANLWTPNDYVKFESIDEDDRSTTRPLKEEVELCTVDHKSLPRHKKIRAVMLVQKLLKEAKDSGDSLLEYIESASPTLPLFAIPRLKEVLSCDENSMSECGIMPGDIDFAEDCSSQKAGELIASIRLLKEHEKRLHDELWYNDPGQANDGPLCRCSEVARKKGIRHNIYPGEKTPPAWHLLENNNKKLYNYLVTVSPPVNFTSTQPTTIKYDGRDYVFEGFSILSHEPLDKLPFCDIIRFHTRYTIYLIEEPVPENFCVKGLQLFADYFFRDILELYDWTSLECSRPEDTDTQLFRKFLFFPRFVRSLPDNGKEILSICEVLKYLLDSNKPLITGDALDRLLKCHHREWMEYTDQIRGMIVTYPGWKPSSLRVDQLDRYDRYAIENPSAQKRIKNSDYPLIIHFGIRPANLSYAGDPQYQKVWRSYLKQRHLMANSPVVKPSEKMKLKNREEALQEMRRTKFMQREVTVEVSSEGFMRTGIFSDVCQHALLLPVLTHHLRYQLCLAALEKRIGYTFQDRKWLSHAMNHPSCQMNFGPNSDHVRNALSNCGLRQPKYGDSSIHYKYTRKRGITTLIRIMARLGQERPVLSPIEHNERLEFLGDAVIGYLTSIHLFFMFPGLSEGALTTFRTAIVNNQHLAQLAERLHLDEYMLYAHGPDLCRSDDLRHAMANCFEALMGAVYMEAGLETAQKLFTEFLWDDKALQSIWLNLPKHPLQEEELSGDRQYIENVPILQKIKKFEDDIGVEYTHIRLLTKAFTWRNVHENVLTHGHNQRLEFLGDSICNLVSSTYLFELYPTHHEGHLTLLRATMVNGRTQSLVAAELGMPQYVISSMNADHANDTSKFKGPDWREKNLADLLEAFVASLYIDKGLDFVKGFMQVCFFPRLKEFIIKQEWNDPKSCLQQCCLTLRQEGKEPQLPLYKICEKSGPSHARKYSINVMFQGTVIGRGQGGSIQQAERSAAKNALEEYDFPQLEWQRRYIAKKHNLKYTPKDKRPGYSREPSPKRQKYHENK